MIFATVHVLHCTVAHTEYRIWSDNKKRQIEARLIHYADGIVTIQKPSMQQFEVPIEEFSKPDQRFVILSVMRPKYIEAKEALEDYHQGKGDKAVLIPQHEAHVRSIVTYLKAVGENLEERFGATGNYPESADFSTRAHSGMLYFANDWLSQLEDFQDSILWTRRGMSLDQVIHRVDYIHNLFTELEKGNNYLEQNTGKQFPIKFLPKENPDLRQYYHYLAYFPKDYTDLEKTPTILWLPGQGEFGADINRLLRHDLPKRLEREEDYPFLVISVGNHSGPFQNDFLRQIYADVTERFKIDKDRVILTGMSSGGAATWRWAASDPELFAAAVPVCGVMPHYEIQCLTKLPIWLFNNEQDKAWIQELAITYLKENNPEFKATIYEDAQGHNAWTATYTDPKLTKWMLEQVRKPIEHPKNPITTLELDNGLSKPSLKRLSSDNFVVTKLDRMDHAEKPTIQQLHTKRYGFAEAAAASNAIQGLYPYFRQLGEPVTRHLIQLVRKDTDSDTFSFALPISELRRKEILAPFEFEHVEPSTALSAIYVSQDLSSAAALTRLRTIAEKMGYQLSGMDRVVYLQPVTIDKYVMELQVGLTQHKKR